MCGILSFSGHNTADETKIRWLFRENLVRGKDSSGLFSVKADKTRTRTLFKKAMPADAFIFERGFKDAIKGAVSLIGHTRAATVGTVIDANSHPFSYGEGEDLVVGVHNGFIIPQLIETHTTEFGFEKTFDVDSQLIFAALSRSHGNYHILSQLEGAITIAWMMPNKWGNHVFLYRREPRELHIGFTKEGIYTSSEPEPLYFIGAHSVWPIQNNGLVVLNEGEIVDYVLLKEPKIKSLKLAATRGYWEWGVPQDEYKEIVPSLIKPITVYKKYEDWEHNNELPFDKKTSEVGKIPFRVDQIYAAGEYGALIEDVRLELNSMEVKPIALTESTWMEIEDSTSCLVTIKLVDSVKNLPLMGFVVMDEMVEEIDCITGLNGIAILRYPPEHCEREHKIIIVDPVDDNKPHAFTIKPKMGRVVEVALSLPFPQDTYGESEGDSDDSGERDDNTEALQRELQRAFHTTDDDETALFGATFNNNGSNIHEQSGQDGGPHQKGKANGGKGRKKTADGYVLDAKGKPEGTAKLKPLLSKQVVKTILKNYAIKKVYPSEKTLVTRMSIINQWKSLQHVIGLSMLTRDAGMLYEHWEDEAIFDMENGIHYYAKWLLKTMTQEYMFRAQNLSDITVVSKFLSVNYNSTIELSMQD